jgi:PAS domain S-box-containing protein
MDQVVSQKFSAEIAPDVEAKRLQVLRSLEILDTPIDELYEDITRVAVALTNVNSAFITFVDEDRVWLKSRLGSLKDEVKRCDSFCQYTIAGEGMFEIEDTLLYDQFKDNPFVAGDPHWRYYAGVPLRMPEGVNVGTLCILDTKPIKLTQTQENSLVFLATTVVHLLSMRKNVADLDASQKLLKVLQEINEDFIQSPENKRILFKKMLDYVLKVTNSEYGFIGEVFVQEEKTALRTFAITDISWNDETRELYKKYEEKGMVFTNHNTLFGYTLKTGESVITNDPTNDTRRGGIPHGHPPLKCYLGLAIKDSKGNLIGMMGLANKKGGYSDADEEFLQPFLSTCGTMIIALKNLQERAAAEHEAQLIQRKLIKAQSIAKLGTWDYDMKTNEVHWSDELYHIYELPIEGKVLDYKKYHELLNPEDVQRNDAIAAIAIEARKEFSFEERILLPDGRTKFLVVTGSPIVNENNEVVALQGTTQDITDRKRQEEEVQRFFSLAVDIFCICSKEGYILRHSRSFNTALGYSDIELKSRPFLDFVHPDDRERTVDEMEFMFRGGTSRNFENLYIKKSGEYITLSWTATFDEESQLIYAAASDVTQKKEMERNLIESQIEAEKSKAKDIFLANMSHEIRTPLNAIIGFNDILSQTTLTEEQRKNVDFIGNASKKLSVLINDILDISKLESGKLDLENSPFRIEEVARQVVQMHTIKAKAKGVKLLFSYDQEIPDVVVGDETRLSQILQNLISNAVKFTDKGSVDLRVLETARANGKVAIYFEVKDSGIGIAKDKLDLIFERFTQAESYTTRVYGGTGLGLNIVRSLVELQNGHLEVESEPGFGSTFRFTLEFPMATEQEIKSLNGPAVVAEMNRLDDMKILLVEDNEHNQILAETYLQKHRASVDIAANGRIALDMLKKHVYDVILMDIQMPIMDGITTTVALRQEYKIDTPIIACSAHAMASERLKCREAGMNDYISKPYTEEGLISVLSKYKKTPAQRAKLAGDNFGEVLRALESNISKTYADKIVGIFKERLPGEIALLEQSLEERDFKLMEERSHYQAGSMSSLHFKHGYQLAYAAERAASQGITDKANEATTQLINYLKELLTYLNEPVN